MIDIDNYRVFKKMVKTIFSLTLVYLFPLLPVESYMQHRSSRVNIDGILSDEIELE